MRPPSMSSTRSAGQFGAANGQAARKRSPRLFAVMRQSWRGSDWNPVSDPLALSQPEGTRCSGGGLEARHARAATALQRNKTNTDDAETLARLLAHGLVSGSTGKGFRSP